MLGVTPEMAFFFILFSNCQSSVGQTKNSMGFVNNSILCCGCSQDTARKRSEDQNLLRSQIVGNHGEKPPEIIRSLQRVILKTTGVNC